MITSLLADPLNTPLPEPTEAEGFCGAALLYNAIGWHVVRLRFGTKALYPVGPAGRSLADHVLRTPESIVAAYSGEDRFSGIGLVQGPETTNVVDYDRKNGAHPRVEVAARCAELDTEVPPAPTVRTPRGEHEYFAGTPLTVKQGYLPGVDVQAGGSYVVAPPSHLHPRVVDPPGMGHRDGWRDPRPWPGYRWVRPGVPVWSDDVPEVLGAGHGVPFEAVSSTAPPELRPDDVWWPTGAELLDAVSRAVLPLEFVASVAAHVPRVGRAGGRSGGGGVPVGEWRRSGLPRGEPQHRGLWLIAASGAGHHRDPEETFLLMREAADASPVLRPGDPWTDDQLRRMAHRAVDRKSERDRRDLEMTREWGRPIMWTEP